MKISNDTLSLLKNFSNINSNLIVKAGSVLRTITDTKSIYAEATVAETFPQEFCIFDLNRFLSTVSLFKDPELEFNEKYITISSGNSSIRYFYCDPVLVDSLKKALPNKLNVPSFDFEFKLGAKEFSEIQKAASVLQVNDLAIDANSEGVFLVVQDKKDPTSNHYKIKVDKTNTMNFKLFFKIEHLRLLSGDYTVKLSKKKISEFVHDKYQLKYWIGMEHDSSTWN